MTGFAKICSHYLYCYLLLCWLEGFLFVSLITEEKFTPGNRTQLHGSTKVSRPPSPPKSGVHFP